MPGAVEGNTLPECRSSERRSCISIMPRRRPPPKPQTPIGLRLIVSGLAGLSVLSQGLLSMTSNRRWQWTWLLAAVLAMLLTTWLAQIDPGVLSKKFW